MKNILFKFRTICLSALCLFTVINQAQAKEFVVLPGDVLQISVWKEEGMDKEVLVLPDGSITFPLVGTIYIQGKPPFEVQDQIANQLSMYIPDATVDVSVKAPLGHKASVLGQVQKPGDVILGGNTNVMQAISQVGGLTPYADEDDIVVIRTLNNGKKISIPYPYDDLIRGRNFDKDVDLEPGDVVIVETDGLF
ncbi:MAG TPA: polysaccharide biosynthesis/export family protein [Alphaproteobacteria bacterium]|nr:polysaccharide biosynthesis/export family protein [Alphaproteobacteria bacterium]